MFQKYLKKKVPENPGIQKVDDSKWDEPLQNKSEKILKFR
jgi:hypothetical protein